MRTPGTPPSPEEGEQRSQPEDVEEGDVVEIVTTTGDVQVVVPKSSDFTSDSAQRMIQAIRNMIDVLGKI
ncbi:hypothetical protein AB205_0011180 [Aquarana catesbeiana]|uniref:Uncharacterized protein n=1 Tax=Aquarana catesbeiana TaxID=8400 RepID=A0A2G9SBI6_AQUCT|nr:hypothetical protein AB205_0011180 [Aquarana catesbeiana]